MRHEIASAQVDSLREWARLWEANPGSGATEIAFLMRRTVQQIARMMSDDPEPVAAAEPPDAAEAEHVRAD